MPENFLSPLTGSFAISAAGNPTVSMMEAAYRHAGLNWRYINCEVPPDAIGDAVRGARAMGWEGFNCSLPHKISVIKHLDGLTESAEAIGAVNTVTRSAGGYVGDNTDGKGFLNSIRAVIDPVGKSVVILGAGGAARAIALELALSGVASITIANRDRDRGESLVRRIREKSSATAELIVWQGELVLPQVQFVVNATSVGLFPNIEERLQLDVNSIEPTMVVADVILNPLKTRLLVDAERRGCVTLNGLGMLAQQGAVIVKAWTGKEVETPVFTNALIDALQLTGSK